MLTLSFTFTELCDIREVVVSLAVVYPAMFSPTKPGTKRDFEFMI